MKPTVVDLEQSTPSSKKICDLLEKSLGAATTEGAASVAVVMVGRDGHVTSGFHMSDNAFALIGGVEALKLKIVDSVIE